MIIRKMQAGKSADSAEIFEKQAFGELSGW